MAINRSDIKHLHWQLAWRQSAPEGGPIVTGYDDIDQGIKLIAITPIGSVPSNPAKGCDLLPAIDKPPHIAIPMVCRALWDAVALWEPRVEVGTVIGRTIAFEHYAVSVPWKVRGDVAAQIRQTEVEINLRELAA